MSTRPGTDLISKSVGQPAVPQQACPNNLQIASSTNLGCFGDMHNKVAMLSEIPMGHDANWPKKGSDSLGVQKPCDVEKQRRCGISLLHIMEPSKPLLVYKYFINHHQPLLTLLHGFRSWACLGDPYPGAGMRIRGIQPTLLLPPIYLVSRVHSSSLDLPAPLPALAKQSPFKTPKDANGDEGHLMLNIP